MLFHIALGTYRKHPSLIKCIDVLLEYSVKFLLLDCVTFHVIFQWQCRWEDWLCCSDIRQAYLCCISVIIASTRLLLTTWLNSWESISLLANFADLLILPFSVFPLYAHTRLVKGHFLMLRRQSGTLSLTKSGHPTSSHFSVHHCGVKVCTSIYIH